MAPKKSISDFTLLDRIPFAFDLNCLRDKYYGGSFTTEPGRYNVSFCQDRLMQKKIMPQNNS